MVLSPRTSTYNRDDHWDSYHHGATRTKLWSERLRGPAKLWISGNNREQVPSQRMLLGSECQLWPTVLLCSGNNNACHNHRGAGANVWRRTSVQSSRLWPYRNHPQRMSRTKLLLGWLDAWYHLVFSDERQHSRTRSDVWCASVRARRLRPSGHSPNRVPQSKLLLGQLYPRQYVVFP